MVESGEVEPGDPNTRRHARMVLVVAIGLGVIARYEVGGLLDEIQAQAVNDPEGAIARMKGLIGLLAMLLSCGLLVLATVVAWIGRRTASSRRYPPPGLPVLGDTLVRRDAAAVRLARGAYVGAALLALGAFAVYWQVEKLVATLG